MPIGLVVPRIEEWTHVLGRRRRDREGRNDPDADGFTTARIDVAGVLERLLGCCGMNASRMLVRRALGWLHEHFPERPLRIAFGRTHAASVDWWDCFSA